MKKIFKPKLVSLLKAGISKKQITSDIFAGIVVGIVALPLAIAFAVASGVSPEKGLITAIVAGFIISLLGGSRVQIGGPTGAFIVIVSGIVHQYGIDGLFIATVMAGIILILFGLLRLGALLKYFPQPLIIGFTSGIALIIFSTQIKDALGLPIASVPSEFIAKWEAYFSHIHDINLYALLISGGTILVVFAINRLNSKLPGSLVAILLMTTLVKVFHLPVDTIQSFFGDIPNKFCFSLPNVDWAHLSMYLSPALTIALLCGIESLLSAVVSDGMISGNHRSNTELIAQGFANIITPFFGGIPATGAIARTATNVKNGGRTPISGIVHAITLLLIMVCLGKWAKLIPMSCLAGILIIVAYNMSEWRSFRSVLHGGSFDIIILLSSFLLTVLVDLTIAIEVGVVLSALLFMKRMADISGNALPEDMDSDLIDDYSQLPCGVGIYEISGPLFFASAKQYAEVLKEVGFKNKLLIIRMRHVPFIDLTGVYNFKEVLHILKDSGVQVILSGVNLSVMQDLKKYRIVSLVGESHIFDSFENSISQAKKMMNETQLA